MIWSLKGTPESISKFGTLTPENVLDEHDGPVLFTCSGEMSEEKFLVYQSAQDIPRRIVRFLIVQCLSETIDNLLNGTMSMLEALNQNYVWAVDQSFDGEIISAIKLEGGLLSVPDGYKPKIGVRLLANHNYQH